MEQQSSQSISDEFVEVTDKDEAMVLWAAGLLYYWGLEEFFDEVEQYCVYPYPETEAQAPNAWMSDISRVYVKLEH